MRPDEQAEGRDRACLPRAVGEDERIRHRAAAELCAEVHRHARHTQAVRRASLDLEGQRQRAPDGVGLEVACDANELIRERLERREHGVTHTRGCTCHDSHAGAVDRRPQQTGAVHMRERGVAGAPRNVELLHRRPALERLHLEAQRITEIDERRARRDGDAVYAGTRPHICRDRHFGRRRHETCRDLDGSRALEQRHRSRQRHNRDQHRFGRRDDGNAEAEIEDPRVRRQGDGRVGHGVGRRDGPDHHETHAVDGETEGGKSGLGREDRRDGDPGVVQALRAGPVTAGDKR